MGPIKAGVLLTFGGFSLPFFAVSLRVFGWFFLLACSFAWLFAWADDWAILALFFASKWRPDAVILSVRRAMQW